MVDLKKHFKTIFWLFLVFAHHAVYAQDTQRLVDAFNKYQSNWPEQRVHLTLNQVKYAPGDTIFFKAYLLSTDLSLWSGSQIVEIALIDSKGEVVNEAMIKTDNGMGYSQLVLPASINQGFYKLTAFTNWMRNFGPDIMYQNEIEIVPDHAIKKVEDLKFGIEGGNLIANSLSNLVVHTANEATDVYLQEKNGALIDSVQTDRFGFAQFNFVPHSGKQYRILTDEEGVDLPQVQSTGYNIMMNSSGFGEDVKLLISGQPASKENAQLSFIISSKGYIIHQESIPANQSKIGRSIGKDKLTAGLYQMSLLNEAGELLSSREFYVGMESKEEFVRLSTKTEGVEPRSPVDLSIQLLDENGNPANGEFSITVQNASVIDKNPWTLEEQIDLQNRIDFNFKVSDEAKRALIDQSLILANRSLNWSNILSSDEKDQVYSSTSLFQLVGFAKDSLDNPLPYNSLLMFYLQNDLMRYEVKSSVNGYFELNLFDIYGEDELFIMAETPDGKEILNAKIDWVEKTIPAFKPASKAISLDKFDQYADFAAKRKKVDHSFNFFSTSTNLDSLAESKRGRAPKAAILDTDFTMEVEDFYLFPTMAEFVKETVRPLRIGREGGKDVVRVKFLEPETNADPLYMIDGIATKNTSFFLSLIPAELKTIQVIKYPKKLSRFGEMAKNGIVIVNTKTGTKRDPVDPNHLILGLNKPVAFHALGEEWASGSDRPEFRTTVYWSPTLRVDQEGTTSTRFYTSDDESPFQIRLEGFVNGKPFTVYKTLDSSNSDNN